MRWTRVVGVVAAVGVVTAAALVASCANQATAKKTEMSRDEMIALGKRLAWTGGCNDCHTPGSMYGVPDTTRLLSGSELGWQGPWGVSYARNLSPDMETGIGKWTEDQIVTALKTGVKPDGSPVLPPMPWPSFAAGMTDQELYSIAAYLKSIPAVSHANPSGIAPGQPVTGPVLVMPPPPAWDAMNLPPPPAAGGAPPGDAPPGGPPAGGK